MGGDPIPGEHWVEIDLEGLFYIDKVFIDLVDWEVAFSNDWTIQVYNWDCYDRHRSYADILCV